VCCVALWYVDVWGCGVLVCWALRCVTLGCGVRWCVVLRCVGGVLVWCGVICDAMLVFGGLRCIAWQYVCMWYVVLRGMLS